MRALVFLVAVGASIAACSTPSAATPSPGLPPHARGAIGDTLRIPLASSISVDGGRLVITFVSRGTDSRCPANAVCVWQGDVAVRLAAVAGTTSSTRELHTGVEPHSFGLDRYVITLVGLLPYPGTPEADAPSSTPIALVVVR